MPATAPTRHSQPLQSAQSFAEDDDAERDGDQRD
jgi:hypothetical protein